MGAESVREGALQQYVEQSVLRIIRDGEQLVH